MIKRLITSRFFVWVVCPVALAGIATAIGISACRTDRQESAAAMVDSIPAERAFRPAVIPKELTLPSQRADYLIMHYWDNFDFSDTAYVHLPEVTEQAFVDYIDLFSHADRTQAVSSVAAMLDRAAVEDRTGTVYRYFLSQYKSYLYDPNSPMRNEEFYIPVTDYILASAAADEVLKSRAEFDRGMMLKNRRGDIASDIAYTLADGRTGRLHQLPGDYTLLFFYDPDCPACKETTAQLKDLPVINGLLAEGKLSVLAIYPDGDIARWREHIRAMPPAWINAYDKGQTVRNKVVYDLRAIPCLYLLDRDKRVLLKDAHVTDIQARLQAAAVHGQANGELYITR